MKSSLGKELVFTDKGNTVIIGYFDAGDASDRRSTSSYCIFMGGIIISWESRKHTIVAW